MEESDTRVMALPIPGHMDIDGVLGIAPESITFDENGDIYIEHAFSVSVNSVDIMIINGKKSCDGAYLQIRRTNFYNFICFSVKNI